MPGSDIDNLLRDVLGVVEEHGRTLTDQDTASREIASTTEVVVTTRVRPEVYDSGRGDTWCRPVTLLRCREVLTRGQLGVGGKCWCRRGHSDQNKRGPPGVNYNKDSAPSTISVCLRGPRTTAGTKMKFDDMLA